MCSLHTGCVIRVRFQIIGNACIKTVGKSQSCMVSTLPIIWKQTVVLLMVASKLAQRLRVLLLTHTDTQLSLQSGMQPSARLRLGRSTSITCHCGRETRCRLCSFNQPVNQSTDLTVVTELSFPQAFLQN